MVGRGLALRPDLDVCVQSVLQLAPIQNGPGLWELFQAVLCLTRDS